VPFAAKPQQSCWPREALATVDKVTVDKEVTAFEEQGALEEVRPPREGRGRGSNRPLYYHSHFTIPKREPGSFRHIINMRKGNEFVTGTHFKMESLSTAKELVRPGDWAIKIDIKSAFTHVAIAKHHRDFFRIRWKGRHLRFKAMPFGYRDAPRVFTMLMRAALAPLRSRGIRLVAYLDDILLLAASRELAVGQGQTLVNHLHRLGFELKAEKCVLAPTQRVEFLGFDLDLSGLVISLPREKVRELRHDVARSLRSSREGKLTARQLASTLGRLRAAHPGFGPANLLSRALQWDLRETLLHSQWNSLATLSQQAHRDLRWWHDHLSLWSGRLMFTPPPSIIVTTDASGSGWGGWLSSADHPETPILTTFGFWNRLERKLPSNQREMRASLLTIECFSPRLRGQAVLLRSDNMTNVANICRGGGRSESNTMLARRIWEVCESHSILLRAEYHPGEINQLADQLSRTEWERADWMLHPHLFKAADTLWGPLTIDMFASAGNHQVPRYFSRGEDPFAEATDALRQVWTGLDAYANPPFSLFGVILRKIEQEAATVVLILPEWRTAAWWPLLYPLLIDVPRRLPRTEDTFLPASRGNTTGVGIPPWESLCVRLSGCASKQLAFRQQLLASLPTPAARAHKQRDGASVATLRAPLLTRWS
jgi:hypothetical protein